MQLSDLWNWPPFMTVRRHNRIVTDLIAEAQKAIDGEYARAVREGRAQIHAWSAEANWNLFHGLPSPFDNGGTRTKAQARAALQEAEHVFNPSKTDLKEVPDARPVTT